MASQHATEIKAGKRFAFGDNWARFLSDLDERRITQAEQSLRSMLNVESLNGMRFLDVGSGSGLFSLAARRLGAIVHSFDYDPQSVACTNTLKDRYFAADPQWKVDQASILDEQYVSKLGSFDVVYSWGVLHHTGAMNQAFSNISPLVAAGGQLFVAIYNDQGWVSQYWTLVKKLYNANVFGKYLMVGMHAPYLYGLRWLVRAVTGRLSLERGMSLWRDMIDWLGGYPFEVAKPEQVFRFFHQRAFLLEEMKTCGGRMGCNELVFRRKSP